MNSFFIFLTLLPLQVFALSLQLRVAEFIPSSSIVKDIYSHHWEEIQMEAATPISCNWDAFLNMSYFEKKGHSLGLRDDTKISLFPISLGVKYNFRLASCLDIYAGLGLSYSSLRIHDKSPCVQRHIHKQEFGALAKTGVLYFFQEDVFLDCFVDYLFQHFNFSGRRHRVERHDLNISGFKVGIGMGKIF
jgi:outer membrane protein